MLISDLKLLLRFNNTSLFEEVSNSTMKVVGAGPSQVLSSGGYVMTDDQYLKGDGTAHSGYNTNISDAMTLGFWLYPVNPGMAISSSTTAVPISMPVMSFNRIGSNDAFVVELTENTTVDGKNNLTVSFDDNLYSASSEDYAPSIWHYFWIVYDSGSLSIYVDGTQHTLQNEEGSLPVSLHGSLLDLYINHKLDGYAFDIAKNYGYISDIFMMNVANSSDVDMQRVINDGVEYLVDDSFIDDRIEKSSIYFNDPDTIIVTSSIDDMSYVYLGRNDGKILRGSPLLWETRRTFARDGEVELLDLPYNDVSPFDPDGWSITSSGFLELIDKSIRL